MQKFVRLPKFVFELGLTPKEISVLLYLCSCANNKALECYPSVGTIAEMSGMGKTATREALQLLEKKGLISAYPYHISLFSFVFPQFFGGGGLLLLQTQNFTIQIMTFVNRIENF